MNSDVDSRLEGSGSGGVVEVMMSTEECGGLALFMFLGVLLPLLLHLFVPCAVLFLQSSPVTCGSACSGSMAMCQCIHVWEYSPTLVCWSVGRWADTPASCSVPRCTRTFDGSCCRR